MMAENVMMAPLFHQRSHSMPLSHAFLKEGPANKLCDFKKAKRDYASITNGEDIPLFIPKAIPSHFNSNPHKESDPHFFGNGRTIMNIYDMRKSTPCPAILNCKMDRGFFVSQSHWTCYRRNYFQVTTSLTIPGFTDQTYALQLNETMQPIRNFLLRLKACTSHVEEQDKSTVRPIALTQMTPKRDKGPQREPPIMPITPADNVFSSEQMGVTFERLQFRVATANNGKRRASQQYFRLVFELVAELPDGSQHTISECFSSPLVVRGRSPGHYSNDLQQAKKKRKLVEMPMPTAAVPEEEKESKEKIETSCVVLPPPQYVYASPPMVESNVVSPASTTTSLNSSNPIPYTSVHPGYLNSSFHNRSQSANDTDFFSRSRALRYMVDDHHHQQQHPQQPHHHHQQSEPLYEQFEVARALRNWQQQVIRQRTDSGATFDSYMSNDSQRQDRPNEPYPIQFSGYLHHSSSWTTAPPPTAATAFRTDGKPNYNHPASGSPKMYPNTAPSS